MNKQELGALNNRVNQRLLMEITGHSAEKLIKEGLLDNQLQPTSLVLQELKDNSPKNAIILAAGVGMRMVPINTQVPKALMEVNGEPLIERMIHHLHEVGITEIHIVVGFMKEQFKYLIDQYGVNLIVNEAYATKNNLHSLALASSYLSNTYIIPCDIWCDQNPFRKFELNSWYMVLDEVNEESSVSVNHQLELVMTNGGNAMIGIAYLTSKQSEIVKERLVQYDNNGKYHNDFWETTLIDGDKMLVQARVVHATEVYEMNTYEQLRELDEDSNHLKSDAISMISSALNVNKNEINNIQVLKKGMTNRSFLFSCRNRRYIMRIPGEGTDRLINRKEEAAVYQVIADKDICDEIVYINPEHGYKITAFLEDSRVCDLENQDDLIACMKRLKAFHNMKLKVNHEFNIYRQIEFYESLWNGVPSVYRDYETTKKHVYELKAYIENHVQEKVLTHIDAVPDNFLFTKDGDIRLIDWEYAGMQDPHVDIAMFCIYALYDRNQVDNLIDIYFEGNCSHETRLKIYCYIAACGLLWSNWCEYKSHLGVEFGEYSLRQYRYAKDYYQIFKKEGSINESR